MVTRRGLLRGFVKGAGSLALAGASTAAYGGIIEPWFRLVETRWTPALPGWPSAHRLRIVALADIHMGPPQMTPERLSGIVDRAMALRPDIIVLLGDYAADHPYVTRRIPARETAAVLSGLRAPLGVWGILGNHDWWDDEMAQQRAAGPTLWHRLLEEAGIRVLENDAQKMQHGGQEFWIAGLGSQLAFRGDAYRIHGRRGADDLLTVLERISGDSAPVIMLAHEPDIFARMPDRVALTLSGHTHGGQVRILGYSPETASRYGNRYAYGHVTEGDRHLVVSGGLGCSRFPIRIGVPPEITIVDLGATRA